jgi:hypothetical protein
VTDLATWLLDRIAEDEAVAREATPGPWRVHVSGEYTSVVSEVPDPEYGGRMTVIDASGEFCGSGPTVDATDEDLAHLARHDPARVLAECAAKRRIVALHRLIDGVGSWGNPVRGCGNCGACGVDGEYLTAGPCLTVRLLALPYADHDGYDPSWGVQ